MEELEDNAEALKKKWSEKAIVLRGLLGVMTFWRQQKKLRKIRKEHEEACRISKWMKH